ncbi:MAG: hypothetical protein WCR24_02660 [Candidatus Methanomethylophilaceae archaeon]
MKRIDRSDAVCMIAAIVLLIMSVMSYIGDERMGYQVNTGLFCAVICLVPMIFRQFNIMQLPFVFVVLIEVSIFLHAYGVLLLKYDLLVMYDTLTHTVSSITVALCVFYALMAVEIFDPKTKFTPKWIPMFIAMIMLTFSVYWEVFEFFVDEFTGTNMQYSPWDTVRDMLCNTFGALLVTISSRYYLRNHTCVAFIDSLRIHPKLKKYLSK